MFDAIRFYGIRDYVRNAHYLEPLLTKQQERIVFWVEMFAFFSMFTLGIACTAYLVSKGLVSDKLGPPVTSQIPDMFGFVYTYTAQYSDAMAVPTPFILFGFMLMRFTRASVVWHYFMTVHRHRSFKLNEAPAGLFFLVWS